MRIPAFLNKRSLPSTYLLSNKGVIATSGEPYHPITRSYSGSTSTHSYNSASSSDLEDLINDILTVEN